MREGDPLDVPIGEAPSTTVLVFGIAPPATQASLVCSLGSCISSCFPRHTSIALPQGVPLLILEFELRREKKKRMAPAFARLRGSFGDTYRNPEHIISNPQ